MSTQPLVARVRALLLLTSLAAAGLPAQTPVVGSRLRAWTSDSTSIIGVRVDGPPDSLLLRPDPRRLGRWSTRRLAMAEVQRLEVSRGRVVRAGGVVRGALVGVLTGLTMGVLVDRGFSYCLNTNGCSTPAGTWVRMAAAGGAAGAVLGAIQYRGDRWEPVR